LLVEDSADDEVLTVRALRDNNITNDIVVAHDGVEALDYLFGTGTYEGRDKTDLPQVVLLDLKLPRIDGHDVLRRIRADDLTALLPVVILTSSREEHDLLKGYREGANSFIVKPVEFREFTEAVRRLGMYWTLLNTPPAAVKGVA
jgi:two-component system response regulator